MVAHGTMRRRSVGFGFFRETVSMSAVPSSSVAAARLKKTTLSLLSGSRAMLPESANAFTVICLSPQVSVRRTQYSSFFRALCFARASSHVSTAPTSSPIKMMRTGAFTANAPPIIIGSRKLSIHAYTAPASTNETAQNAQVFFQKPFSPRLKKAMKHIANPAAIFTAIISGQPLKPTATQP